jgi:hypothetical protein
MFYWLGCYNRSLSPWPIARDMQDYLKPVIFACQPRFRPIAKSSLAPMEKFSAPSRN